MIKTIQTTTYFSIVGPFLCLFVFCMQKKSACTYFHIAECAFYLLWTDLEMTMRLCFEVLILSNTHTHTHTHTHTQTLLSIAPSLSRPLFYKQICIVCAEVFSIQYKLQHCWILKTTLKELCCLIFYKSTFKNTFAADVIAFLMARFACSNYLNGACALQFSSSVTESQLELDQDFDWTFQFFFFFFFCS